MRYKKFLLAMLGSVMLTATAQESDTLSVAEKQAIDEMSDFSFTESQLDEDADASQIVSSISSSNNDLFFSEVGYRFSAMRFKIRGYDNFYQQNYLNGILMNDMVRGSFSYAMIGGLNDVTRNKEGVTMFENNNFGVTSVGGGENTNLRASSYAQGGKVTLSGCNRNYKARAMFSFGTGWMKSGWAFAGQIGYRWADEGVVEGTFYNSFSYLFSAQKRINDSHSINIVTFGTPTERAQQGASTEEAYWLANDRYYNPNWGYQNGKKRNARVVHNFEPTVILNWDWDIDYSSKLNTALSYRYSAYSTSALGWGNAAMDPRPDYYKKFPSSSFNVWDETQNNGDWLGEHGYFLEQYNTLVDYWKADKANRQIQWDNLYYENSVANKEGREAEYYVERRHSNQQALSFATDYIKNINATNKIGVGINASLSKTHYYKTMDDLLGAQTYTDLDKFAARDYGTGSQMAQNDLLHPNRQIKEGDRFGYDYDINVNKATGWAQYQWHPSSLQVNVAGHIDGTTIERKGGMQNGRAPENSLGSSGTAKFLGGGGKVSLEWMLNAHNRFMIGAGWEAQAPLAWNAFVAARMQNNFVDNLKVQKILNGEVSYRFRFGDLSGKIGGYYTQFKDGVEQTAFYNDQEERFTYLAMNSIEKRHYGFEGALKYKLTSSLSFNVLASVGEAEYTNNPYAQVSYEGMDAKTIKSINQWKNPVTGAAMPLRVIADGIHEDGTPLTALSFGVEYSIRRWFFEANLNYYDRVYIGYSPYRRLSNVIENYTSTSVNTEGKLVYDVTADELNENGGVLFDKEGNIVKSYTADQEKFKGGFMLDLSVGRLIYFKKGQMSINLSLQNVTNNQNLRTGGYEQSRDDNYNTGQARTYKFSRNSKYFYAYEFNAFLNVNYKF